MEKHNVLYSDRNVKEDIENVDFRSVRKAMGGITKQFRYKDDPEHRLTYGVIAQDLEAAGLNELVHIDENGVKAVDYTSLLMLKYEYLLSLYENLSVNLGVLQDELEEIKKEKDNK